MTNEEHGQHRDPGRQWIHGCDENGRLLGFPPSAAPPAVDPSPAATADILTIDAWNHFVQSFEKTVSECLKRVRFILAVAPQPRIRTLIYTYSTVLLLRRQLLYILRCCCTYLNEPIENGLIGSYTFSIG